MQVTAISSAYTGAQKHNNSANGKNTGGHTFEDQLLATRNRGAAMKLSDEEVEQALNRAMARMENQLGSEVAESVINDDGSVNVVRFAQVMSAADRPYANSNRATFANAPQVVNLIA